MLPRLVPFTFAFCLVFQGFACLGWAVLGPYNFRFSSFGSTCEMLFSLMYGDDVFATIRETEAPMQMFGYIYISTFITVFSFVLAFFSMDFITTFFEVTNVLQKKIFFNVLRPGPQSPTKCLGVHGL
ncbi:unnamed protein product, partial [Meganyctiphanes norvegica]